jgi:hypothetical protein
VSIPWSHARCLTSVYLGVTLPTVGHACTGS